MEYMLEGVYSHVAPCKDVAMWLDQRYGDTRGGMDLFPPQVKFMESQFKTDQAEF
jgi:hypothetical protein